jgi:hypothetical protein
MIGSDASDARANISNHPSITHCAFSAGFVTLAV